MRVTPQQVALTCCGRTVVLFDYPRLSVIRGAAEYADPVRERAGWRRIRVRCGNPRHRYERVLKAETLHRAVERAAAADPTMVAAWPSSHTASALRRGDVDEVEASAPRRRTKARIAIPLEAI